MTLSALRIRGPFRGGSGYEHHVRAFTRELVRKGLSIELIDLPEWGGPLPVEKQDPFFDTLLGPVEATMALQFCMPSQFVPIRRVPNVNFTMFEATSIPREWAKLAGRVDMTILPTESSRRAWIESGVAEEKLRLCPLGVDPVRFSRESNPLPLQTDDGIPFRQFRCRFLNVSAWNPRKNLTGLFRTWLLATNAGDDAALFVRIGGNAELNRLQAENHFALIQKAVGKSPSEAAPVILHYDYLPDDEMTRLYQSATHYLSMSHGEGWDLPMTEAIASGLIPIAPDHSAYQEYLDPTVAHLIPASETRSRAPYKSALGKKSWQQTWWDPDERAADRIIRGIIEDAIEPPASARSRILADYSWERSTRRLRTILDEVDEQANARRFWKIGRNRIR